MFNEMVQRTELLFFSPVEVESGGGEHRFNSLPSFLTALSATVKQMHQVRIIVWLEYCSLVVLISSVLKEDSCPD